MRGLYRNDGTREIWAWSLSVTMFMRRQTMVRDHAPMCTASVAARRHHGQSPSLRYYGSPRRFGGGGHSVEGRDFLSEESSDDSISAARQAGAQYVDCGHVPEHLCGHCDERMCPSGQTRDGIFRAFGAC